jgi:hypothetical protein
VTPLATCLFYRMSMSAVATQVLTDCGHTCGDKQCSNAAMRRFPDQPLRTARGGWRVKALEFEDL